MQKLFYCTLFLFFLVQSGFSQVYDRSIGVGFFTEPDIIRHAGNDRWMIAGRGQPEPGQLYQDTVFLLLLDREGHTIRKINIPAPSSEVHYIREALPVPGGFAVVVSSTLCDVVNDIATLFVLNEDGSLRWKIQSTNGPGSPQIPDHLALTPDGNLFGIAGCFFQKYDLSDGDLLWQTGWNLVGSCYAAAFSLEPGTENVVISSGQQARYFKQTGMPGSPTYVINQSWTMNGYPSDMIAANGVYYLTSNTSGDYVIRLKLNGMSDYLSVLYEEWQDIAAWEDGLYLLGRHDNKTRLLKTDWDGQIIQTYDFPDPYLFGLRLDVHHDTLAVAGIDGCAMGFADPDNPDVGIYPNYKGKNLWFHTSWGAATPGPEQQNATATNMEQTIPMQVVSLGTPNFPYYKISGGHFRIQVKNSGNVPIRQLYVNTVFKPLLGICFSIPARRIFFDQLDIQPGASQWLELGGLGDVYQEEVPGNICFWTSAPNGHPDADHPDDLICPQLLVSDNTPAPVADLRFYPNPTSEGAYVESAGGVSLSGEYRLYDATGRTVLQGEIAAGETRVFLPTAQLPVGLYCLKLGNRVGKLVVER